MGIFDEMPRGQLSTVILMCLKEQDKYGYEIIDEVLKKTNGKMSIKQPSLYSSLKRMEEQSLISSYWRDSDIGGRRHYYHLTDLGKKHLEKWQENLPSFNNETSNNFEHTRVLQQENLFNLTQTKEKTVLTETESPTTQDDSYVQFHLFSSSTIVTAPTNENILNTEAKLESVDKQNPILTEYEKNDVPEHISKFEFIKKGNKSFADTVKSINTVDEKRYINDVIEADPKPNTLQVNNSEFTQISHEKTSNSILKTETTSDFQEDNNSKISITEENIASIEPTYNFENPPQKINISMLEDYVGNAGNKLDESLKTNESEPLIISEPIINEKTFVDLNLDAEQLKTETKLAEDLTPSNETPPQKEQGGGIFITERLDIKDIPKPPKFEPRRFEVYISDDSISPSVKEPSENYEDRIKKLYEKSKANAENQEIEVIDTKVKFTSYKDLQDFYTNQNIKFKPYQKTLYKSDKDFDMIRVSKLNMLTALLMFLSYGLISLIFGISFMFVENTYLNNPITFIVIPLIMLIWFGCSFISYRKSPQKRVAYDINKFKFNINIFLLCLLIIPTIFAINLFCGFSFANILQYLIPIFYPLTLAFAYPIYYFIQKRLTKSKTLY